MERLEEKKGTAAEEAIVAQRFGARLRELRQQAGITQKELADKIGTDFTYLSKIESGVMPPPSEKVILRLAEVFNTDLDALMALAGKIPSDIVHGLDRETLQFLRRKVYQGKEPSLDISSTTFVAQTGGTMDKNELGKILKQQRRKMGLTLTELSSATGVSGSHLGRIENGNRSPSGHILRKIAGSLSFEEDELLILAGFKSPKPSENVEVLSSKVDPYVAKILSKEPVETQRSVVAILTLLKSIVKARNSDIEFAEYVHRKYPQVDEDIITMVKDILENPTINMQETETNKGGCHAERNKLD